VYTAITRPLLDVYTAENGRLYGPYTAVQAYMGRVHGPYTAVYMFMYTDRIYTAAYTARAVYTARTRLCTQADTACSRPRNGRVYVYTGHVHGHHTAVYSRCTRPKTAVCTVIHGRVHVRVHGPATRPRPRPVVYTARTRPCTRTARTRPVMYPARTWPFTRADTASTGPCNGRVHGPCTRSLHGVYAPCTRPMHGSTGRVRSQKRQGTRPSTWPYNGAVNAAKHGRVHCPYSESRPFTRPIHGHVHV